MSITDYLAERRRVHAATGGDEWEAGEEIVYTPWSGTADWDGPIDDRELVAEGSPTTVAAIVDAHRETPRLLNALEAVLDVCRPHYEAMMRRETKFGRTESSCVCEQCQVMQAVAGALGTEAT